MLPCTLPECKSSERQSQQSLTDLSAAVPKVQSGLVVMQQCVLSVCALTPFCVLQLAVNRNQLDSADSVYKRTSVKCCLPCTRCSLGSPV